MVCALRSTQYLVGTKDTPPDGEVVKHAVEEVGRVHRLLARGECGRPEADGLTRRPGRRAACACALRTTRALGAASSSGLWRAGREGGEWRVADVEAGDGWHLFECVWSGGLERAAGVTRFDLTGQNFKSAHLAP